MVAVSFSRYLHFGCVFASFLLSDVLAASIDKRFHERSVFERRSSTLTPGWARSNRLSPDTVLPLRIGLAQQNLDKLESELLAVSHPESPDYGKHWTPEEIVEFFKPKEESVQLVREWLTASGLEDGRHRLSKAGNWIEAQITVKEAEELLEATYHSYEHVSGTKHIGAVFISLVFNLYLLSIVQPASHTRYQTIYMTMSKLSSLQYTLTHVSAVVQTILAVLLSRTKLVNHRRGQVLRLLEQFRLYTKISRHAMSKLPRTV